MECDQSNSHEVTFVVRFCVYFIDGTYCPTQTDGMYLDVFWVAFHLKSPGFQYCVKEKRLNFLEHWMLDISG